MVFLAVSGVLGTFPFVPLMPVSVSPVTGFVPMFTFVSVVPV